MVTYAKILHNNPLVQLHYRLNFSFWKIEIIAKIINKISFSLLLIIAMHMVLGSLTCSFYASIPEIEHSSC